MPGSHRSGKHKVGLIIATAAAILIAAGSVGIGLFYQAAYYQDAQKRTADYASDADSNVFRGCRTLSGADEIVCRYQKGAEAQLQKDANNHDEADLVAQRKAALWAEMMGIAALLGMALSVVGVWLVWITFDETREGNRIQARIGEAQTRAYLAVPACKIMFRDGRISIQPMLGNSGQSPALDVRWRADISILAEREGAELREGKSTDRFRAFFYDVPAQGTRETLYVDCDDFAFGPDEAAAFAEGADVNMAVEIALAGKDVFDNEISKEESFLHTFHKAPPNLEEIDISHSSRWDSEAAADTDK